MTEVCAYLHVIPHETVLEVIGRTPEGETILVLRTVRDSEGKPVIQKGVPYCPLCHQSITETCATYRYQRKEEVPEAQC